MKKARISILFILLIAGCKHNCDDIIAHNFTTTELDWFSFGERDTLFFRDVHTDSVYYLICTYETVKVDSQFNENENCSGDGYYFVNDLMISKFNQNFPSALDYDVIFELMSSTKGLNSLNFEIRFYRASDYPWVANGYVLDFSNETETLSNLGSSDKTGVLQINSLRLNGKAYENIVKIYRQLPVEILFDTIYFNKNGFLKLCSSKSGAELERIE